MSAYENIENPGEFRTNTKKYWRWRGITILVIVILSGLVLSIAIVSLFIYNVITLSKMESVDIKIIDKQTGTPEQCAKCGFAPNSACAAYRYECGDKWYWTETWTKCGTVKNYCSNISNLKCYRIKYRWPLNYTEYNIQKIAIAMPIVIIMFCLIGCVGYILISWVLCVLYSTV